MNLSSNVILITGGGSGIGLAFAERFLAAGNSVIICGRDEAKLRSVQSRFPSIHIRQCDVAVEAERIALCEWAVKEFPKLNVFVNNAGVQRYPKLRSANEWKLIKEELTINIEAAMHLPLLLAPHLAAQPKSAILNVTSGLSFVPLSRAPVYSATKAAMHSFTLSLRHHLRDTSIEVIEIIPPAVQTDLGGPGLHDSGVPLAEFADAAFEQLKSGSNEVSYGFSAKTSKASRAELDETFKRMNQ